MKHLVGIIVFATSICFSQYSLTVDNIGGASRAGEENFFRAQLMNNGSLVHTFERSIPFDVPFPAAYVHKKTGTVILSYIFDGFVEVYDASGKKQWEQNFFKEMGPNYERTITIALGENSIAFLTSDVTLPHAVVHVFMHNGLKQWEKELPYAMGYEIAMSPDEKTVFAGSYAFVEKNVLQSSSIINNDGTVERNIDILFRKAAFSNDNSYTALTSEKEIVVIENQSMQETGRINKNSERIISDVIWDDSNIIVQESEVLINSKQQFYYSNPVFIRYSTSLLEIARQKLEIPSFKSSVLEQCNSGIEFRFNDSVMPILR